MHQGEGNGESRELAGSGSALFAYQLIGRDGSGGEEGTAVQEEI